MYGNRVCRSQSGARLWFSSASSHEGNRVCRSQSGARLWFSSAKLIHKHYIAKFFLPEKAIRVIFSHFLLPGHFLCQLSWFQGFSIIPKLFFINDTLISQSFFSDISDTSVFLFLINHSEHLLLLDEPKQVPSLCSVGLRKTQDNDFSGQQ